MIVMMDLDAEVFKLTEKELNFVLLRIRSHVPEFLVLLAADYLVDRPGDSIGYGHLGLVGRAKAKFPTIVFSPIKRSALQFGTMCCLDKKLPKIR